MLTVCIQAGGASTRMGEDKALKLFLGEPLIQRVAKRLRPIADELIVTTNHPEDFAFLGVRLIRDLEAGRGALGGLYTAIASAAQPIVAIVACDMPFASVKLIEIATRLLIAEEADVVIPNTEAGYEPFHAVYRRAACLPIVEAALRAGQWKATAWLSQAQTRTLTAAEIQAADPRSLAFWNLNTPEEFAQAEEAASAQ
ncbi:MAG: molybdenum cofactor guanylyltransferase [Anaerolineaceae bacterium]|nr:molybdenum cofactor guanylyltransferase [Anaerolineaceae bacterium]